MILMLNFSIKGRNAGRKLSHEVSTQGCLASVTMQTLAVLQAAVMKLSMQAVRRTNKASSSVRPGPGSTCSAMERLQSRPQSLRTKVVGKIVSSQSRTSTVWSFLEKSVRLSRRMSGRLYLGLRRLSTFGEEMWALDSSEHSDKPCPASEIPVAPPLPPWGANAARLEVFARALCVREALTSSPKVFVAIRGALRSVGDWSSSVVNSSIP
mmetsp:Transcript_40560/g.107207  ORF Transcript_40560/g.107207 Transcript_40560/m.107207 type:complete len:210 (-) Transcript_40560:41-670(-)